MHGVDQVGEGAAEAVELPDDEHVARPARAHAAVEFRAVGADGRPPDRRQKARRSPIYAGGRPLRFSSEAA